jgi:hypothetical protein
MPGGKVTKHAKQASIAFMIQWTDLSLDVQLLSFL